jgi:tripartite-type tricarboxylate transporter receptor subunit TctC
MHMLKGLIAAIAKPTSALFGSPAAALRWPQRPVKFILPLGVGSGTDYSARLIAEKLSARWGQPVVVENRPGVDGLVATAVFAGTRDEHTLLFGPASAFTAHPYLHDKLPYDPRDLVPIARVSATLVTVCISPSLDINSLSELVAMARAQPGKLNWATITGAIDMVFAGFLKSAGLDMAKISYHDTVQAVSDVAEGRLHLYQAALATVQEQAQAGRVKIVAITASERAEVLPNVPTVAQTGFPALTFDGLVGLYGTRDMPVDLRKRIAADVKIALADPAIVTRLTATGQVVVPGSAAEFAASIEKQRARVAKIAKVLGLKAQTGQFAVGGSELF